MGSSHPDHTRSFNRKERKERRECDAFISVLSAFSAVKLAFDWLFMSARERAAYIAEGYIVVSATPRLIRGHMIRVTAGRAL